MFRWTVPGGPPWSELNRLRREMDSLLGALTRDTWPTGSLWRQTRLFPLLNVRELQNAYVVTAEIPGMKLEDLELKVEADTLALKGERKAPEVGEGVSFHRRERASGTFQRSITLPRRVDAEGVTATYRDGVLTVTLPVEKAAVPKQISVKAG